MTTTTASPFAPPLLDPRPIPPAPAAAAATRGNAPANPTFHDIDLLLRDRHAILDRIRDGENLTTLARAMILTIAVAGAVFGGAVGAYRGGLQILYAAVKLPLVILFTAAVCAPALSAINAALDRRASLRRDLALVLAALALGSLVLAAEAPLVLLAGNLKVPYHDAVLLTVACCAVAGFFGLSLLVKGLCALPARGWLAALSLVTVFSMVGAQMSWTLRPYLVRPRALSVPLLRGIDSNLFESVRSSLDSARGVYSRDQAPLPGQPASETP